MKLRWKTIELPPPPSPALDTVIITQLNRRFSHVPYLIREVTALMGRLNELTLTI